VVSININAASKQKFDKRLKEISAEIDDYVRAECEDSLLWIEEQATLAVPVDFGFLKNSIQTEPIKKTEKGLTGSVEVGSEYAAYVEFGTGTTVDVPAGLEDFAIQFKGAGIKQVNLQARPFFYPAVFKQQKLLPEAIKKTIETLLKR
jgi:hypothetical protein